MPEKHCLPNWALDPGRLRLQAGTRQQQVTAEAMSSTMDIWLVGR
jgi:hypothetical protein